MDRTEAIEWLKDIKESEVLTDWSYDVAIDLAIEALVLRDKYVKALERMIEGVKEINKFLDEAAKKSDEKLQLSPETSTISEETSTCKLKKDHDFLIREGEKVSKEQKSGLDLISRQQAINAVENTDINITESEWDELINAIDNLPPVTPTVKVQQADTLIIATALRDFAQDSKRNITDRERAEELREQVLECGASMCYDTPTERTGEWTNTGVLTVHCSNCKSEFHELEAMNYCPNCGAKMGGDTE